MRLHRGVRDAHTRVALFVGIGAVRLLDVELHHVKAMRHGFRMTFGHVKAMRHGFWMTFGHVKAMLHGFWMMFGHVKAMRHGFYPTFEAAKAIADGFYTTGRDNHLNAGDLTEAPRERTVTFYQRFAEEKHPSAMGADEVDAGLRLLEALMLRVKDVGPASVHRLAVGSWQLAGDRRPSTHRAGSAEVSVP